MNSKFLIALCAVLPALPLAACADGRGYGGVEVGATPYGYDGYYDDFYGPIYDGYWGDDGAFYYRGGAGEHRYRRGDAHHFSRGAPGTGGHFHPMQGTMTPGRGMHMPHFNGGGAHNGGGRHR
jgi:hypothetical protein